MTKRTLCNECGRPLRTCICKHVRRVANLVQVIILQHPLEAGEAKNTGVLLHKCLENSRLFVGEQFDDQFFAEIQQAPRYDLLLYPDTAQEKSLGILTAPGIDKLRLASSEPATESRRLRLWVLDATWRKSRKMLYLNQALQSMPRLSLQDCPKSLYKIRKAHSENQLCTLEASCYALEQLEYNFVSYAPVIDAFANFVAEQYDFLPTPSSRSNQDTL